jgi:hypothetical protein
VRAGISSLCGDRGDGLLIVVPPDRLVLRFPPATVVSYRDQGTRVLAEVQRCEWAPAGGPPVRYALAWSRAGARQEQAVPAWDVELPPGTAAPWLAAKEDWFPPGPGRCECAVWFPSGPCSF